jgi:hypothetical protein
METCYPVAMVGEKPAEPSQRIESERRAIREILSAAASGGTTDAEHMALERALEVGLGRAKQPRSSKELKKDLLNGALDILEKKFQEHFEDEDAVDPVHIRRKVKLE